LGGAAGIFVTYFKRRFDFCKKFTKVLVSAQMYRHASVGNGLLALHLQADSSVRVGRPTDEGARQIRSHNSRLEVAEMKHFIVSFLKDEEGLTMVEYAIAGALVAAGAVVAFTLLGTNVTTKITELAADVLLPA
jgi:pilus assembly protein Flp/PilA